MQEKIPSEKKGALYPSVTDFFEDFKQQFPRQMGEAKSRNNTARLRELENQQAELDQITRSLAAGDTGPARKKLASMIGANVEFVQHDISNELSEETHGQRIGRLARYLVELENPQPSEDLAAAEASSQTRIEGRTTETTEMTGASSAERLAQFINELKMIEGQLRKGLAEFQTKREELENALKRIQLSKLKEQISNRS